jgi:GNAT superfamily N-acetyltransferase
MLEVFFRAIEDLDDKRGRGRQPRNAAPLEMHFEHLLTTDPASSLVADDHGRVVGFGIVMRREARAFLSFLFVEPRWQARGMGRAILDACLAGADGPSALATCAEADQPISTGLYASRGLAPRVPIYLLRGALADAALPPLPAGVRTAPVDAAVVAALDIGILGYQRPGDHAWWARGGREGLLFLTEAGEPLGYGYAQASGRLGPVAAVDPGYLPGFVGQLVRTMPVLEGRQVVLPGPCIAVMAPLLRAGLRIDGTPAVYCSDADAPAFDRYIPMSYALL